MTRRPHPQRKRRTQAHNSSVLATQFVSPVTATASDGWESAPAGQPIPPGRREKVT